jgi:Na+/H+-translocating membrane pyrophosphatase
MIKTIAYFSLVAALLLLFIQFSKYQLFTNIISLELFTGLLALVFTILGVWFGLRLTNPKEKIETITLAEKNILEDSLLEHVLSKREIEILQQINLGKSNQEIAETLFISISTVKSHISKLFSKLDVKK